MRGPRRLVHLGRSVTSRHPDRDHPLHFECSTSNGGDARARWGCFDLGLMTWCITYTGSMGKHRACQLPVKWTVALPGRSHDAHYSHRCVTLRVRLAQGAAWPCRKDGICLRNRSLADTRYRTRQSHVHDFQPHQCWHITVTARQSVMYGRYCG